MRTALGLALFLLPYYLGLEAPAFWDANESLYAEPPREVLISGEWLVPTMNGKPWFVKPPGATWAILPFYALFGASPLAERLAMAVWTTATLLLTWQLVRAAAGARAGLLAFAILATMGKFFLYSRQLAGDVFLTTCLTAAAWGYLDWFRSEGARRRGLWAAAAALGIGTLMKGPVALVLSGLVLPLHLWVAGRRGLFRRLRPWGPLALALLLAAPWFVYMALRFGRPFLAEYFGLHHFGRFFTTAVASRRSLTYYLPVLLGELLPWSLALPGALVVAARRGLLREEPVRFALLGSLVIVGFFSLSVGKRAVYVLPVYPLLAAVLATVLARAGSSWRQVRWLLGPLPAAGLALAGAAAWCGAAVPVLRAPAWALAAAATLWTGLVGWALLRADANLTLRCALGGLVPLQVVLAFALHALDHARPAPFFGGYVRRHAAPGDDAGRYWIGLQSLTFYAERPFFSLRDRRALLARLRRARRTWLVLPAERLPEIAAAPGLRVRRVAAGSYLQLSLPALRGRRPLWRRLLLVCVEPRGP